MDFYLWEQCLKICLGVDCLYPQSLGFRHCHWGVWVKWSQTRATLNAETPSAALISIDNQNNMDLNQYVLHLLSEFGSSSSYRWWVVARTSSGLTHWRTDTGTHRQTGAENDILEGQTGLGWNWSCNYEKKIKQNHGHILWDESYPSI